MQCAVIEVNNTSSIGRTSTLNRDFIVVLAELLRSKQPQFREFLSVLIQRHFEWLQSMTTDVRSAFDALNRLLTASTFAGDRETDGFLDQFQCGVDMLVGGQRLNDCYLQSILRKLTAKQLSKLLRDSHIRIRGSCYVMAAADPLGVLRANEVFIVTHSVVTGTVIVSRNPCHHPGDVRTFEAVPCPELQHFAQHSLCGQFGTDSLRQQSGGIFFSIKGQRAAADLISNGDYDGDLFWSPLFFVFFRCLFSF